MLFEEKRGIEEGEEEERLACRESTSRIRLRIPVLPFFLPSFLLRPPAFCVTFDPERKTAAAATALGVVDDDSGDGSGESEWSPTLFSFRSARPKPKARRRRRRGLSSFTLAQDWRAMRCAAPMGNLLGTNAVNV